jgi:amino acid permease
MKRQRSRRSEFARTFTAPGLLALVSGAGLVIALVSEGVTDVVAGVGVAAPLVAVVIAWLRRSGR